MVAPHASHLALNPLPGARTGRDPERAIKRGPRRVPAEVVAATQRDRLFDGLVHTVADKGYANARVSDICQAAGVTRPAFYTLFAGKDDAFLAAYRHGTDVVLRMMEEAYREAAAWPAGCRAALRVLLEVLASVPAFATMAIVEIDSVGATARHERDELLRRFDQFFLDAPHGPEVAAPDDLIGSVVGGLYTTIHRYVATGRVAQLPTLLPGLTYFMVAPFLGRQQAASESEAAARGDDPAIQAPCAS
ncbi:TetR/AcrR family transcriptional regulator [Micromonospora sp. NPDC049679]|uniref:TetR/AcrR family transcriptional regulator n=1 Tax=Micromonospora sp. NPDC049679 TaxID=3155920 RepID=UPI00340C37CC